MARSLLVNKHSVPSLHMVSTMLSPPVNGAPRIETQALPLDAGHFLDRAHCLLVALDRQGQILQLNNFGASLLGVSSEQSLRQNWFKVFLPKFHREQCLNMYKRFMEEIGPGKSSYIYPLTLANQLEQNFLWFHTVIVDDFGQRSSSVLLGQTAKEESALSAEHHENGPSDYSYRLSPKERQIAEKIRDGYSSKDISALLKISNLTVDRHRNNIRQKLEVPHEIRLVEYLKMYL